MLEFGGTNRFQGLAVGLWDEDWGLRAWGLELRDLRLEVSGLRIKGHCH